MEPTMHFSFPPFSTSNRWWSKETVAIVTGANKGIGFALVKRFAELGLTVVLAARDKGRGETAVESLKEIGLDGVHFFPLDVSEPESIKAFVDRFGNQFGTLDILVNNAAVSFNDVNEKGSVEHAETVIKTNFYGAKLLTESLMPFFRRSSSSISRILNLSSRLGSINKMKNPNIKSFLLSNKLSEEQVEEVVEWFMGDVRTGTWENCGWPEVWTDYAVSKLALNAYSKVLARRYEGRGLSVNCFCPGFTQTSMTGGQGTHSADDAAEVGAKLALLPPKELPTGKFYLGFGSYAQSRL